MILDGCIVLVLYCSSCTMGMRLKLFTDLLSVMLCKDLDRFDFVFNIASHIVTSRLALATTLIGIDNAMSDVPTLGEAINTLSTRHLDLTSSLNKNGALKHSDDTRGKDRMGMERPKSLCVYFAQIKTGNFQVPWWSFGSSIHFGVVFGSRQFAASSADHDQLPWFSRSLSGSVPKFTTPLFPRCL